MKAPTGPPCGREIEIGSRHEMELAVVGLLATGVLEAGRSLQAASMRATSSTASFLTSAETGGRLISSRCQSEAQSDQVRVSPRRSCIGGEHRLAAPVSQRSVLVEQQRVGSKELVEARDLRTLRDGVGDQAHPEPGHGVVVRRPVAVVLGEFLDALCHDFLRGAAAMAPDGKPREAQVVTVVELGVGQREGEKGAQKLIVGDHGLKSLLRKRNDPAGSPLRLRLLPCGWCQNPRTFPSGPLITVSRPSWGWQSPIFVARLRRVAVRLKKVADPAGKVRPALDLTANRRRPRGWRALGVNDLVAQLDALVTDENARARNELSNLVLGLPAKVASLINSGHAKSIGLPVRS